MTCVKFILLTHFITCGWVLMLLSDGKIDDELDSKGMASNWVDAAYLMYATISTVGYGDISGRMTNESVWLGEMLYMTFAIVATILLFSLVTTEVFAYKHVETKNEIIRRHTKELESFFQRIGSQREDAHMPDYVYTKGMDHLTYNIRNGTRFLIGESEFYQTMPPLLRKKLVRIVLKSEMRDFKYFFGNVRTG